MVEKGEKVRCEERGRGMETGEKVGAEEREVGGER